MSLIVEPITFIPCVVAGATNDTQPTNCSSPGEYR